MRLGINLGPLWITGSGRGPAEARADQEAAAAQRSELRATATALGTRAWIAMVLIGLLVLIPGLPLGLAAAWLLVWQPVAAIQRRRGIPVPTTRQLIRDAL